MKAKLFGTNPMKRVSAMRRAWQQRAAIANMLRDAWRGDYRMSFLSKGALLLGLLYILSPIDLIPDFLPILGWGDDVGMVFLLLGRLASEAERYQRGNVKALSR